MRVKSPIVAAWSLVAILGTPVFAQGGANAPADTANDPIRAMVSRLELAKYKATVKGLTQFGDRRQGTKRNRDAVDWIEAQLKSYGCTNTERIKYDYQPAAGGQRPPQPQDSAAIAARRAAAARSTQASGGGRLRGNRARTGVNTDSLAQPDPQIRAINMEPTTPGERQEVYCTKVGTTHPEEMYIVGGHMDGHGWGEAANDDGSGTAIVMELARVFSSPDVQTDRSIRFILWNNEETGLNGARAYVEQRQALQGKESPAGSKKYPEPKWLGMIQHDMMMWDHGMPRADGTVSKEQRPEADVNIEFQSNSKMSEGVAEARLDPPLREREVRDGLSGAGGSAHDEHGQRAIPGPDPVDQSAGERAWSRDRRWLGSELAPADRRVHDVQRQGLSARHERGADDPERHRAAHGRDAQEVVDNCRAG